jgi:hypothetical protein
MGLLTPFSARESWLAMVLSVFASTAAAQGSAELPRILVLDLSHSDSIDMGSVKILNELLAVEMSRQPGYDVLSGADVRRLVALEAEKQSVGCADDASCLAEIAGAMGAQFVVSGSIGKLGTRHVLTLTLFDSHAARSVNRVDLRAASIDEIADGLAAKVKELISALATTSTAPVVEKTQPLTVEHKGEHGKTTVTVDPETKDITINATSESDLSFLGIGTTLGLVGLGGCGFVGGTLFDVWWYWAQTSSGYSGYLDPIDFVGPAIALGGVATALTGAVLIPFLWWDEPDEETTTPESSATTMGVSP